MDKRFEKPQALLPICATCKRIRTADGTWRSAETSAPGGETPQFTHGICPDCSAAAREELRRLTAHPDNGA